MFGLFFILGGCPPGIGPGLLLPQRRALPLSYGHHLDCEPQPQSIIYTRWSFFSIMTAFSPPSATITLMDILSTQVASLAGQNIFLAYLIIYGATIFFGNIGAFISLWVTFQGGLGIWGILFTLIAIFAANVSGDLLWYTMGRTLRTTRLGGWIKNRFPNHGKFDDHIERNGPRWMLFAKFVYGSNFPIIFSLGWAGYPLPRFFRRSLLAIALWLPIIVGVSYGLYSSLSPLAGVAEIKHFEILLLAALVAFFLLQYGIAKIVERFFGGKE